MTSPRAPLRRHLVALLLATLAGAAEVHPDSIQTADGARAYLLALPRGGPKPGAPLVLLFHGHMGSARNTLGQGRGPASPLAAWLPIVDREGVVVAALDGARGEDGQQGWNDGRPGLSGNPRTDDVAFARGVIQALVRSQGVDPNRVFAMGMSNGGVFVFRLALEVPLAGIAAVCASMPGDHAPPTPPRPVSVLMIEGTEDPLMPYGGGQVHFFAKQRGAVLGTPASLAFWRAADHLEASPQMLALPKLERGTTRLTRYTWGRAPGIQVRLLQVDGGGHCEPSLAHRLGWVYTRICGPQNHDAESAEEAWSFFRACHPPEKP